MQFVHKLGFRSVLSFFFFGASFETAMLDFAVGQIQSPKFVVFSGPRSSRELLGGDLQTRGGEGAAGSQQKRHSAATVLLSVC